MTTIRNRVGTGACRLFGKFLLIFVPLFLLTASIGLSLVAEKTATEATDRLVARLGSQIALVADGLSGTGSDQFLLSTLLNDPAISCAEIRAGTTGPSTLEAPQGLGCKGQDKLRSLSIPVRGGRPGQLVIRFNTDEVSERRKSYREFAILVLVLGMVVASLASYMGFRMNVGEPIRAFQSAIESSRKSGRLVRVPVSGEDELSQVMHAYNRLQETLAKESVRVREANEELDRERSRNEQLLSQVFQVSPYPFVLQAFETGRYEAVNDIWTSTMGFSRDEVIGRTADELRIWVDSDVRKDFVNQVRVDGLVQSREVQVRTKDGRILDMLMSGEIVDDGKDARMFIVAHDITRQKQQEAERLAHHREIVEAKNALEEANSQLIQRTRELEDAQESLVQQERLATLGELTATVSHELRNPLAAIRSSLHLVKKKTDGAKLGLEKSLDRAERNIVRCDGIISDLLGYASEPKCDVESLHPDSWLRETLGEIQVMGGIGVDLTLQADQAHIEVSSERIRQVIVILVENAVQAMSELPDGADRKLGVATSTDGEFYRILISDTGPGIDPETMQNIFKPLFSTKSYGCGLGLPTALKIVERFSGTLDIESRVGVGTSVTIAFPLSPIVERAA